MISVIIPAYNQQEYLRQCIDSAVGQKYGDKEIIVVNDGSTDNTADILASYSGIKVISTHNQGLSSARNTGVDASKGEWITFLDADDMLLPDSLEHLIAPAMAMDADVCIGGQKTAMILSPETALRKTLYRKIDGSAWGKLYRRDLLLSERFTPQLYYEDLDLLSRLYRKAHRIVTADHAVYYHRPNPAGISQAFSERRFDLLKVTYLIERNLAECSARIRKGARNRRLAACLHILHMLKSLGLEKQYSEIRSECLSEVLRLRSEAIADPASRIKIRIGALLSYLGVYL